MRGTLPSFSRDARLAGITPAYAGNTYHTCHRRLPDWDYPRICGEHGTYVTGISPVIESPPHMRGTLASRAAYEYSEGITPAHAENTSAADRIPCRTGDHPRTCGEHSSRRTHSSRASGSPPHMRGTHRHVILLLIICRITPAHAGNTTPNDGVSPAIEDHPRTCGEHNP